MDSSRRGRRLAARALAGTAALALSAAALQGGAASADPTEEQYSDDARALSHMLQDGTTLKAQLRHLGVLQTIARRNDNTRAAGSEGYDQSVAYIAGLLRRAGYDVTLQEFPFTRYVQLGPSEFEVVGGETFEEGVDFGTPSYSGSGEAVGTVVEVDVVEPPGEAANASTSGCEAEDFAGFPAGSVALVQRGTCAFGQKAENAQAAGAVGVVIYNEGTPGDPTRQEVLTNITLGRVIDIPVVGVSYALGRELVGAEVRIATDTLTDETTTHNIIAETEAGDPDEVVMYGAHLDSVEAGPGINDNGSGSVALLDIALALSKSGMDHPNKVRFAWWGAEEAGLIGSTYYVSQLTEEQAAQISLYYNFDMIGSPNYFRGIYDGSGDITSEGIPEGSAELEELLEDHFDMKNLPYEDTEFSGRSDYGPFIAIGIPSGGIFTGAEGIKTEEQVEVYGGVAGAQYDPCYHLACDSYDPVGDGADADLYAALEAAYPKYLVGNVNNLAQRTNADAIAHTVGILAFDDLSTLDPGADDDENSTGGGGGLSPDHGHDHGHGEPS